MRDYGAYRKAALRYWERRRIFFNLALIPPGWFGYGLSAGISAGLGDQRRLDTTAVALLFLLSAVGANLCYSFGYALEFLFGCDTPESRWRRFWRPLIIVLGTLLAMLLAMLVGRNIAWLEYSFR